MKSRNNKQQRLRTTLDSRSQQQRLRTIQSVRTREELSRRRRRLSFHHPRQNDILSMIIHQFTKNDIVLFLFLFLSSFSPFPFASTA